MEHFNSLSGGVALLATLFSRSRHSPILATIESRCCSTTSPTAKASPAATLDQRVALLRRIDEAARAGVDYIQLREKDLGPADLELIAREALHRIRATSANTKLLINGRVDVALEVGADGVHLPANSPPVSMVRREWSQQQSRDQIISVSAHTIGDVQRAGNDGATFAVLAPIFEKVATGSKGIGLDALRQACKSSPIPVLALGGVSLGNARACLTAGAAGIAGIRVFQETSLAPTVEALRWLSRRLESAVG